MRRPLLLLIPGLLILAVSTALSQSAEPVERLVEEGPYPYLTVDGDPLAAREYRLPNGLTVITAVNRSEPWIQTMIAVRAGSAQDPATHTGLAHYLEHMLFKGTDRYGTLDWEAERRELQVIEDLYEQYNSTGDPERRREIYRAIDSVSNIAAQYSIPNEYDRMVAAIGARRTNAFTWLEQTVYVNDVPANQLERWIQIEAERFRAPVFRLFHTELEAVYEEKNISLDDDENRSSDKLFEALLPDHPYGTQTTIGTVEHLKNPSLRKIREYYDRYYVPNNMAIILSGDFDPDRAVEAIAERFAYMEPKGLPDRVRPVVQPLPTVREVRTSGPDPEVVDIAFRFPGSGTREALLMELVGYLLHYNDAGRLDLNLAKPQRVRDPYAWSLSFLDYSTQVIGGRPNEGQSLEEVRDLLLAELQALRNGEFSDADIASVVRNVRLDRMKSAESHVSGAYMLLDRYINRVPAVADAARLDEMARVSRPELLEFLNRWYGEGYAVAYKVQGERDEVAKVEKPTITPVGVNRTDVSPFAQSVLEAPSGDIEPVWIEPTRLLKTATLQPGVEVLTLKNVENERFVLRYRYEIGSWHEPLLPFAARALQLSGTSRMSPGDVAQEFFRLGSSWSINVRERQTTISLEGPQESFPQAVSLLESLLADARIPDSSYKGLIGTIAREREEELEDQRAILFGALKDYAEYGKENPTRTRVSLDRLEALESARAAKIVAQLNSYPHSISFYGPLESDLAVAEVGRLHATPGRFRTPPERATFTPVERSEPEVFVVDHDMVRAELLWIRTADRFDEAAYPVTRLFNEYFGSGMSSIVFQTIRESKALAYSSFAAYALPEYESDRATVISYIGTQADKMADAIEAMNELHRDLPASEQAYESVRSSMRNSLQTERFVRDEIIEEYFRLRRLGVDRDLRRDLYSSLDLISLEDLQTFHQRQFSAEPFALCIVGPLEEMDLEALKKFGRVTTLSKEEIFGH